MQPSSSKVSTACVRETLLSQAVVIEGMSPRLTAEVQSGLGFDAGLGPGSTLRVSAINTRPYTRISARRNMRPEARVSGRTRVRLQTAVQVRVMCTDTCRLRP